MVAALEAMLAVSPWDILTFGGPTVTSMALYLVQFFIESSVHFS